MTEAFAAHWIAARNRRDPGPVAATGGVVFTSPFAVRLTDDPSGTVRRPDRGRAARGVQPTPGRGGTP